VPTFEADGRLDGFAWTSDWAHVANFELPKTRFLSKWMTARRVANGGSPATGVVVVRTVSLLTLRGFSLLAARLLLSETETSERPGSRRRPR
jgi:hypothetical protein